MNKENNTMNKENNTMDNIDYDNCTLGQAIDALYSDASVTYITCNAEPEDCITTIFLNKENELTLLDKDGRHGVARYTLSYIAEHAMHTWFIG